MENLTLDFNNFGSRTALGTYEKCDSLTLTIVLDEKDYAGYKFKIVAKKSDGHIIEQDIKEQDINREEKIIKTELNNQFTTKEGVVKLEINMIKDGKEDTTKEAFFIVRDTINGEVVESTSIIPTLEGVKAFIDEAVISLGDLEQAGEDIALINGEFKEAEIKRKANELLRERSEKERVRLESIRTTEEADRIKAEAERKEAENNRKVAESNRKLAENTRKTNEAARVEAELNRQSLFEENEEIRNENENLRIEAEKERKLTFSNNNKFESERVEAEKLRAIAEDKRVTAEKARANAEEERIKAETRRENTYTDFNDSEVERKNNEANRVRAEAERVNAESGRNELFNTNEEKRNSTFIESERTRERAFNEAQSNRNEAYEESERVREEAFKVSEAARNEAEEGRVAAELLRVEAEKLRVAGEENRNTTFTQSEEERKTTFEEAENARKVAESKRVKAESSRVEAEKLRVTAETGRVEAESLRATAEEERVAAETKREEGFNKFEGRISANTEELKNARSATTGEKFDTLDERIDHEVDRLNKKIDITMLQQEDKENHVIENTVEGMSTDMVIKGRTLQNVFPSDATKLSISSGSISGGLITINAQSNTYGNMWDVKNPLYKTNTKYSVIIDILENTLVKRETTPPNQDYLFIGKSGNQNDSVFSGARSLIIGDGSKGRYVVPLETVSDFSTMTNNYGARIFLSNVFTSGQLKLKIMILEGDWTNKPIPQYFEGIKSFGQQEDKISILSSGKNLFNKNISVGIRIGNDGITENSNTNCASCLDYIEVEKGKTYEFVVNSKLPYYRLVMNYDENKKFINYSALGELASEKFIANGKFVRLVAENLRGSSNTEPGEINFMLCEFQKSISNYEPYKCDKKDILLQDLGFDEGLRGLSPTVYDELNDIKNVAIKRIEKIIINGNTDDGNNYLYYSDGRFVIKVPSLSINKKDRAYVLCDKLPYNYSAYTTIGQYGISGYGDISAEFVGRWDFGKTVTDRATFIEYLKTNPITVYYELAEPIETPLDENINLKTFGEKTYVSFENAISGTSSFKAPVDTTATIARLNRENRALEEENAKLKADTYKNAEDIIITNEELQITQSAVDHLLFSNLNASGTAMLYNGKKKGGGSMGAYLAMRIIKGKLKYEAVMKQYGEFKEDIDLILEAEGYGHLITQQ